MTKNEIKAKFDRLTSDVQGARCGACGEEWRIWYSGVIVIGRIRCACEKRK